jgi:hypothetical protein
MAKNVFPKDMNVKKTKRKYYKSKNYKMSCVIAVPYI